MFELALLAVVVVWLSRRQGWGRTDLERAAGRIGHWGRSALGGTRNTTGPDLLAQCAADVKALVLDLAGLLPSRARDRIEHRVRRWRRHPDGEPTRSPIPGAGGGTLRPDADDSAIARLQRRYIAGRISLDEYLEATRRLRAAGPGSLSRPPS